MLGHLADCAYESCAAVRKHVLRMAGLTSPRDRGRPLWSLVVLHMMRSKARNRTEQELDCSACSPLPQLMKMSLEFGQADNTRAQHGAQNDTFSQVAPDEPAKLQSYDTLLLQRMR